MKSLYNKLLTILLISFSFTFSQNIDSLLNLLETYENSERVDLLLAITSNYIRISPEQALPYVTEAIELSGKIGYHKGEGTANLRAGFIYANIGEYDNALEHFNTALEIAKKHNLKELQATSLNSIGNYFYLTGNQIDALTNYNQALEISREISFYNGMLNNLNNLGIIYSNLGDYEKAVLLYIESLSISEKVNDLQGMANTYINIGTIYYDMKDFSKALDNYKRSYELGEKLNNKFIIAICLINIGLINNESGNYDQALKNFNEALLINEETGNKTGIANSLSNIGLVYYHKKSLETSLEYHKKALNILEEIGNREGAVAAMLQMSIVLRDQQKYGEALSVLEKAKPVAEQVSLKLLTDIYFAASTTYAKMGNFKNAYEYSNKYNQIRDSLFTINNLKTVTELQTKYDFEKKEQEIELLTRNKQIKDLELSYEKIIRNTFIAGFIGVLILLFLVYNRYRIKSKTTQLLEIQNKKIQLQSEELQKLNASKDKFFSIIAHDLRNPFNSLLGFSEILKSDMENLTQDERIEYSTQLYESSKHILDLVNNLLEWAGLQSGKMSFEPEIIEVNKEIADIMNILKGNAINKNITIKKTVSENLKVFADKRMLHSIVLNLVSNAIKYSYPGGAIEISTEETESETSIFIKDQGVGMNKISVDNLFKIDNASTTRGTHDETGTGLGLILCKEMIDIHNGNISVQSEQGKGTTFKVTFPEVNHKLN